MAELLRVFGEGICESKLPPESGENRWIKAWKAKLGNVGEQEGMSWLIR